MQFSTAISARSGFLGEHPAIYLFSPVALGAEVEGSEDSCWVHFAPYGTWQGHENGPFAFTKKVFESILGTFNSLANDLQVDYGHDSVRRDVSGPKPAAGWIKALEIRGDGRSQSDGLWGFVEWTKRAATFIRNREYKYTSPVINLRPKDRKTGKETGPELFNAALTNDPFLDGQVPLTLERLVPMDIHINNGGAKPNEPTNTNKPLDAAAPLADNPEAGGGSVIDKIATAAGLDSAAVEAVLLEKLDELVAMCVSAQSSDGTPADQATAQNTASTVASDRWSTVANTQLIALSARVNELEREKADAVTQRILARVNEKIETGYIYDHLKDDAMKLYREDWDRAERMFATQVCRINSTQSNSQTKPKTNPESDAQVARLMGTGIYKSRDAALAAISRKVN